MAGLFGAKQPKPKPVVPLPDASDPLIKSAENERLRLIAARSGRTSTNLSQPAGSGGVNSYANSTYGQN